MTVIFRQYLWGPNAQASYLVACPGQGVAAVVDPAWDIAPYLEDLRRFGLRLTLVVDTHVHADHVSGARRLVAETNARQVAHTMAPVAFPVDRVEDGEHLDIGNVRLQVVHTPGHTPEHIALLGFDRRRNTETPWFLLTGHSLMVGDVGRPDLAPADSAPLMYHTLFERLAALPDYVEVWPGAYSGSVCGRGLSGKAQSTLGFERRSNPALRASSPEAFSAFLLEGLPPKPQDFALIRDINCGLADPAAYLDPVASAPVLTSVATAAQRAADSADCCAVADGERQ